MVSLEGINLRINKFKRIAFSGLRRKKLKNLDFTIISNNCWGGMIYESYNLKKNTPTVGLFFMAEDYIKFLDRLNYYINCKLSFINPIKSKHYQKLKNINNYGNYPVGVLDDIEIFFVHYKSENEAKEKWERRINRINFNNLIVKFNDQNGCKEEDLEKFLKMSYKNKLFFTVKDWNVDKKEYIKFFQIFNKKNINASKEPFGYNRKINITKYLNSIKD